MPNNILKYDSEIVWSLPCFFQYEPMIGAMHQCVKRIEPDTKFNTETYGAPATVWTGEIIPDAYDKLDAKALEIVFEYHNEIDTIPVYTFTNTQISKEDIENEYANFVLDYSLELGAKFEVYSDELKNHIKEKNADAQVIASPIKAIEKFQGQNSSAEEETAFYNNLLKEYDRVALRPEYVKNVLLKDTSVINDLSKVQIVPNYPCVSNCNNCLTHIKHFENFNTSPGRGENMNCPIPFIYLKNLYEQNASLTSSEIELLFSKGVRYFKFDKGKNPNIPIDILMPKIGTQIFNTDGANYLLFNDLLHQQLMLELEYFQEKFSQCDYYRKVFMQNVQQ